MRKRTVLPEMTLSRFLLLFLLALVLLCLVYAPAPRPPSCRDPQFQVGASDGVFFQNLRSYFYRKQVIADQFILHRFKKAESDPLQFLLVEMPLMGEWHIRPFLTDSSLYPLTFEVGSLQLTTDTADSEDYWRITQSIYTAVLNHQTVLVRSQEESIPLLVTEDERKRAEQVLFDYFRLIGCN